VPEPNKVITDKSLLWREHVERYHYLGCPRAVRGEPALLGAESRAGTGLPVVDIARLENAASGQRRVWLKERHRESKLTHYPIMELTYELNAGVSGPPDVCFAKTGLDGLCSHRILELCFGFTNDLVSFSDSGFGFRQTDMVFQLIDSGRTRFGSSLLVKGHINCRC
jgi:hypothetical protein